MNVCDSSRPVAQESEQITLLALHGTGVRREYQQTEWHKGREVYCIAFQNTPPNGPAHAGSSSNLYPIPRTVTTSVG